MNRVLLAGSSFSALPILQALKAAGMHVTVAGRLKDDPCHAQGDASLYFDYADKDLLLGAVRGGQFDFVVPSCNDESYRAGSSVAAVLGLPGYDDADNTAFVHTKNLYRPFLAANDMPTPRAAMGGDYAALTFPVLVKPADSAGGKGVSKVPDMAQLPAALDKAMAASNNGQIIVEEFFDGTLHSHSAFIAGGKIHVDFFADEFCTVYPYQVNCSNHPSRLKPSLRESVRSAINRMIDLRGFADGLLHTQFMTNGHDIRIIESMRRHPGDLYGRMIEYSTGFDYAAHFVAPFISRPYPAAKSFSAKPVGRHTISTLKTMTADDVSIRLPAERLRVVPLKTSGQRLEPTPYDKFGLFFVDYADEQDMLEKTEHLADFTIIHGQEVAS